MSLNTNEHDWAHLGMIDIITHDYTRLSIYAYKITIGMSLHHFTPHTFVSHSLFLTVFDCFMLYLTCVDMHPCYMMTTMAHNYLFMHIRSLLTCLCIISLISEIDAGLSHIINIGAKDTILRVSDNDK